MNTIEQRQSKSKRDLVDQLKKVPIIQVVCERLGIGRTTYYRWRKDDKGFSVLADEAIQEGEGLINDLAESQLMSAIKDKNMTAIIFWLKHHHKAYTTRIEIESKNSQDLHLTPEQENLVKKALALTSLPIQQDER